MRIVHLLTSEGYGGAERVATTLLRLQNLDDQEVRMIASDSPEVLDGLRNDLHGLGDVDVSPRAAAREWILETRRHLERFQPEVVHLHLPTPSHLARALSAIGSRACVATFHLLPLARLPWDRLVHVPSPWVVWAAPRLLSHLVCAAVSLEDRRRLAKWVPDRRLHAVPNAPPLPPASPDEHPSAFTGVAPGTLRILSVGRFVPQKAMTRLIAALGDPLMKDQSWHYSAIGDGPERQHCFELSRELGIAPRVSWLGARPAHDAFSEADLMILPSEFEGRPLVLLEALDSGVPILASDIPAHREVLGAGSPALLPAEVGAWPQRISQVIESESERRNIREATRGLLPDAPQQIQAQRYLELYQQAMS